MTKIIFLFGKEAKKCTKCQQDKLLSEFPKNKREKNKILLRKKAQIRRKARALQDPEYRLLLCCRSRISDAIRRNRGFSGKNQTTKQLIGCSLLQLRQHIESKWQPGMTWENYGIRGWHIDHIKPCASFILTDEKQLQQCFFIIQIFSPCGGEII